MRRKGGAKKAGHPSLPSRALARNTSSFFFFFFFFVPWCLGGESFFLLPPPRLLFPSPYLHPIPYLPGAMMPLGSRAFLIALQASRNAGVSFAMWYS